MRVVAIATALLASFGYAATPGDEIKAIRDDVRALCHKAWGAEGAKHCRYVSPTDEGRHIVNNCYKSGWSGHGSLRCDYGQNIHKGGRNDIQDGAQTVFTGANGEERMGRRRVQVEDEHEWGLEGPGDLDEFPMGGDSDGSNDIVTDVFDLENLTDEEDVMNLKDHVVGKSLCILQGMVVIPTEDPSVNPSCNVKVSENNHWQLSHTSARCHVMCVPFRA